MLLERLRLTNVRNQRFLEVSFAARLAVLTGPNGAGKTSVLEAVHLLLRGSSPRTTSPKEVITRGEDFLRVEGELRDEQGRLVIAALGYDLDGERRATRNGAPLEEIGRWEEDLPVRAFLPDHLQLVKGSPSRRRIHLDLLSRQGDPEYRRVLANYEEALRQRNHLLREGRTGEDHAPWEGILAREGMQVARRRAGALAEMAPFFTSVHAALAGEELKISLVYRTNVAELDSNAYRQSLASERSADRQRGFTRLGPHRDDIRFILEGRDLRELGSQGEQRTALLALLLAEREWLAQERGRQALLLLDDVMSELDYDRRRRFFGLLHEERGQALITTTTLDYFTPDELATMGVVELPRP